jgi:hypothetical protein
MAWSRRDDRNSSVLHQDQRQRHWHLSKKRQPTTRYGAASTTQPEPGNPLGKPSVCPARHIPDLKKSTSSPATTNITDTLAQSPSAVRTRPHWDVATVLFASYHDASLQAVTKAPSSAFDLERLITRLEVMQPKGDRRRHITIRAWNIIHDVTKDDLEGSVKVAEDLSALAEKASGRLQMLPLGKLADFKIEKNRIRGLHLEVRIAAMEVDMREIQEEAEAGWRTMV